MSASSGVLGDEDAVELRHSVVHVVRHLRPFRLVVDLRDVSEIGPINLGTLSAACHLGDDHQVAVFVDNSSPLLADQLAAAGVARHRLLHAGFGATGGPEQLTRSP
jgi:anti-anti-sigma regulatory factor